MKNNMNEMNDEMEITLNESYTFPVISIRRFVLVIRKRTLYICSIRS